MATGLQSAATPYDKPMEKEHRKILKESRQALVEDMEPKMVLRQMIDPHLFTDDEKDRIMANNLTRQDRNEILLDILPRKGAGAYEVFKETIKKAHPPLLTILVEAETKVLASELGKVLQQSPAYREKQFKEDDSKIIIFRQRVTGKAFSCFSEERGVDIKFSPKTMPEPRIITCYLCPKTMSPPLEDDETLVSSVIQLQCDDPVGVNFRGITLALSHSAVESRQYDLVMKELINISKNTWKDLDTAPGPRYENCELRFVQARITSFSLHAVICRLKTYTFSCDASVESTEITCQVPEYPGMSVIIPRKFMSDDIKVKIKVQHVPNDDFEKKQVLVGPILHMESSREGEFEEPTSITIPIALEQDKQKVQNVETSHVRLCSREGSQGWVDITKKLTPPAKLGGGGLTFQTKSTDSRYVHSNFLTFFPLVNSKKKNLKKIIKKKNYKYF